MRLAKGGTYNADESFVAMLLPRLLLWLFVHIDIQCLPLLTDLQEKTDVGRSSDLSKAKAVLDTNNFLSKGTVKKSSVLPRGSLTLAASIPSLFDAFLL